MIEKKIAESLLDDGIIKISLKDLKFRVYLAMETEAINPNTFYFEKSIFADLFCKKIIDGKKSQTVYQIDYGRIIQTWPEFSQKAKILLESAKKTEEKKT